MSGNDDWRRERADRLRQADPDPWTIRPVPRLPPAADDVLPMQPPPLRESSARQPSDRQPSVLAPAPPAPPPVQPLAVQLPPAARPRLPAWWPLVAALLVVQTVAVAWLVADRFGLAPPRPVAAVADRPVAAVANRPVAAVVERPVVAAPKAAPPTSEPVPIEPVAPAADPGPAPLPTVVLPEPAPTPAKILAPVRPVLAPPAPAPVVVRPRAAPTAGPSFNCRRARANVTRMICADAELARLDRDMSALYFDVIDYAGPAGADAAQNSRTAFLNRRGRCASTACIARVYRDRIDDLRRFAADGRR